MEHVYVLHMCVFVCCIATNRMKPYTKLFPRILKLFMNYLHVLVKNYSSKLI